MDHKAWLKKALNDLKSAQALVENDLLDTAIYHTQQCAEKALKGFLVYQKQSIKRTHDLRLLIDICVEIDEDFNDLRNLAEELTPYAVEFRYPTEWLEPDKEDVLEAIEMAEEIFKFVEERN
ncbi:HEPN domain-containing protein [Natroniella sulfidigena]|uniref:HEPN domain-containing protein n=1 Tax=Natroniella sulfidigena TaxID=723921 RepID=UPI00200B634B|nr:HEPN domain-containing protein [Natroniella sulfidigena]MCK8816323.1 HEPN domain-containing protein [Natroniella sulfidigena]